MSFDPRSALTLLFGGPQPYLLPCLEEPSEAAAAAALSRRRVECPNSRDILLFGASMR